MSRFDDRAPEPGTRQAPGAELLALALRHVEYGSIDAPETPGLVRRAAKERLGVEAAVAVALVADVPAAGLARDDFVLVEHENRPGVRNYRLARVPRNSGWRIRAGAFERALRRFCVRLVRRALGAFRTSDDVALLPGPSRC